MVIDYTGIKWERSSDLFLGACQRKECLRLSLSEAEQGGSERVLDRTAELGRLGCSDNHNTEETRGLH